MPISDSEGVGSIMAVKFISPLVEGGVFASGSMPTRGPGGGATPKRKKKAGTKATGLKRKKKSAAKGAPKKVTAKPKVRKITRKKVAAKKVAPKKKLTAAAIARAKKATALKRKRAR